MKNSTAKFLAGFLVVAAYVLAGCSNKASSSGDAAIPVTQPGSGSGTATVPVSSFMVTTDFTPTTNPGNNPSVTTYLHRSKNVTTTDTDWSNACSVPQSETDNNKKYINCLLEVNELDLWFNNFSLNWGAAPNMCAYVEVFPFWFFQYKADLGAANNVSVSYTITDGLTPIFDGVAGSSAGGIATIKNGKLACAYDYSGDPIPGPNCCEGTYNLTVTTCTTDPASGNKTCTAPTTSLNSWGGQWGNCASGPATQSSWGGRDRIHNLPIPLIWEAVEGIGQALSILSPSNSPQGHLLHDLWSANYYKNATPSPLADVASIRSFFGTSYVFVCYDNNEESIARIDLQIRKWNTYSEMLKKQAGDPTVVGPETPFPGNKLDLFGWDEFITYGTSSGHYPYPGGDL